MTNIKTSFLEKVGYGFGDMSSSMFWKIFSYYLPFFYTNIFGLRLDQVGILLVVTRIWDAVSDPMMGVLADRTRTRWGKYRPYLLIMALPFALSGIFLFTTPNATETMKLVWAYITYIMMMTVYTGINVPYGAMLRGTLLLGASVQPSRRIQHACRLAARNDGNSLLMLRAFPTVLRPHEREDPQ